MGQSHYELANAFASGEDKAQGSRMFIDGNVIYSYGYHFPICIRLDDGSFVFNKDGYSMSTSRHKNFVKRACDIEGAFTKVIFMTTEQMKEIINLNLKTADEIIIHKI